jgi:SAM-dependent methyltransferase
MEAGERLPLGKGVREAHNYDSFAEAYSAENEASLFNACYERPATLALAGDVAGRRVTGFDKSAKMLAIARRRLGDGADLRVADLGRPLPFPDGAFDDVIASLVLHYLQDWTAPLAELRRVLRPGGRLIASVDHPLQGHPLLRPGTDYFATCERTEEWTFGGRSIPMRFWHRPLPAMISAFTRAGFRIAAIDEPLPAPDTPRELLPDFREADWHPPSLLQDHQTRELRADKRCPFSVDVADGQNPVYARQVSAASIRDAPPMIRGSCTRVRAETLIDAHIPIN